MNSEVKQIAPGEFFLHFQNSPYDHAERNLFSYKFKTSVIFPREYRWKVAVKNCYIYHAGGILCSDLVSKSHVYGDEIGVLFIPDQENHTLLYVSVAEECLGVPIKQIHFQLKQLHSGTKPIENVYSEESIRNADYNISGWLHFKSE